MLLENLVLSMGFVGFPQLPLGSLVVWMGSHVEGGLDD